MRDREAADFDIAYGERGARLEAFESGLKVDPVDGGRREPRDVDGLAAFPGEAYQAGYVIGMLMRDQNGIQVLHRLADRVQAGRGFFTAQPGVNEDARPLGGNEGGVAGTAARENADLDDDRPFLSY
jgi:hypothetical protein